MMPAAIAIHLYPGYSVWGNELHRHTIGDFELTVLSDGTYWLDGGAMFGVVPKPLWEKKLPADEQNRVTLGTNSLLVRTGDRNVLIETGIGPKLSEKSAAIYGHKPYLLDSFANAGVSPDEIDVVINTHLHFDHCGWNTMPKGDKYVATFPRAKYYVQRGEWEHASRQLERDRVSYNSPNYDPLIETGQMELIVGDREIVPGISVRVMPGHTRWHQAVYITSGEMTGVYVGDLIPTTAHMDLTWVMAYDLFPLETIENRKKYYEEAIPKRYLTIFTHDHQTPWAYVEPRGEGKYTWTAATQEAQTAA